MRTKKDELQRERGFNVTEMAIRLDGNDFDFVNV